MDAVFSEVPRLKAALAENPATPRATLELWEPVNFLGRATPADAVGERRERPQLPAQRA